MYKIPIKYLRAAQHIRAKKDIRHYLKGLAVQNGKLCASDGAALLTLPVDIDRDFLITGFQLDTFLKSVSKSSALDARVTFEHQAPGAYSVTLDAPGVSVPARYADTHYPDVSRAQAQQTTFGPGRPQLDVDSLVRFQKVAKELGAAGRLIVVPGETYESSVRIVIPKAPQAHCTLMPLRPIGASNWDDALALALR